MKISPKMIDASTDLLHDIKAMDQNQSVEMKNRRAQITASTMRSVGFSDQEIVDKIGRLPEPIKKNR